jgi:hypothetical protein
MCFGYGYSEIEKDQIKSIKQRKNTETEKLEERVLAVIA